MRIQFCSDLHLEMRINYQLLETEADVIVLAGDISAGVRGIEFAGQESLRQNKPVIYVAGNHEHYHHDYSENMANMKALERQFPLLHFLECDELILDGTRFLGATLWTDYVGDGSIDKQISMEQIGRGLNDHHLIRYQGSTFSPANALALHNKTRTWLSKKLDTPFDGKTVVVSHHGPSLTTQHKHFKTDAISAAFLSDLDPLVSKADLWIYGHSHSGLDSSIGKCRLVSNQLGYPMENLPVEFRADWVVEL